MSLQTITEINLDINQPGVAVVHAKQYDTVRQVKAHLFYNGIKWLVPNSNYVAVVGFKKADRIGGFYDTTEDGNTAITVDGSDRSIIYALLDRNTVTTPGNTRVEITFYDTITTGRLSTFSFILQVEEATVTELDLTSSPYFNILAEDIKKVIEAVDSMTGLSADVTKLAPDDDPTVSVTGGTSAGDPYVFHLGIPSMPGVTVDASKRAPSETPTAQITGGEEPGEDYNISFGIPAMPGMTVSASQLQYNQNPTATITGGTWNQQHTDITPYHIAFGIPRAIGIVSMTSKYGESASESVLPGENDWVDTIQELVIPDGHIGWTKNIALCDDGNTYLSYAKALQGSQGPPGVAVQTTEPETTVKVWVNPDNTAQPIVIPEYTADEDAMIHSFSGVLLTTVKSITRNVE